MRANLGVYLARTCIRLTFSRDFLPMPRNARKDRFSFWGGFCSAVGGALLLFRGAAVVRAGFAFLTAGLAFLLAGFAFLLAGFAFLLAGFAFLPADAFFTLGAFFISLPSFPPSHSTLSALSFPAQRFRPRRKRRLTMSHCRDSQIACIDS